MSHCKEPHEFVTAAALLVACVCSTSCTAWHAIPLQPERFSADTSPEQARLTFGDGSQTTVSHPVLAGDSLVWARGGATPQDSVRSAVPTTSVRVAEVHRVDAARSIVLLAVLGGVVLGARALVIGYANSLGN